MEYTEWKSQIVAPRTYTIGYSGALWRKELLVELTSRCPISRGPVPLPFYLLGPRMCNIQCSPSAHFSPRKFRIVDRFLTELRRIVIPLSQTPPPHWTQSSAPSETFLGPVAISASWRMYLRPLILLTAFLRFVSTITLLVHSLMSTDKGYLFVKRTNLEVTILKITVLVLNKFVRPHLVL